MQIANPIVSAAKKLGAVFFEKASLDPMSKAPKVTKLIAKRPGGEKFVHAKKAKVKAVKATPSPLATGKTTET